MEKNYSGVCASCGASLLMMRHTVTGTSFIKHSFTKKKPSLPFVPWVGYTPLPKPSKLFNGLADDKTGCTLVYVCIAPGRSKVHKNIDNLAKKA